MERYVGVLGLVVMIALAWAMSSHKRHFPWRVVIGGLALQLLLAVLILRTEAGRQVFQVVDNVFVGLLNCVDSGSVFLFGANFEDHLFAFRVLPTIIFFSAFTSIFYHYGILQKVVGVMAWVMQKTLGASGAESLSAAANVFVGQTEAPLVIRPYISTMTVSELNAVMVGGFATMAGSVLGALSAIGIDPGDLLSASVISAPGALLLAKIMQPEVDHPKTLGRVEVEVQDNSVNVLEAIAKGATAGLKLALNVGAMLIVFLALIAVANALLGLAGEQYWRAAGWAGFAVPVEPAAWSVEGILGWLFAPLAWLIGINWEDCPRAGQLMGLKMATNEFVAYDRLAEWTPATEDGSFSAEVVSNRTRQLLTYAMCGFANFGSIGIQLGGIGGIAPERRGDLARLALRAMLGGAMAAYMTACIAGILI